MLKERRSDSSEPRITLKVVDMENRKALYAQQVIRELILSGNRNEKDVATRLKRDFDEAFGEFIHANNI